MLELVWLIQIAPLASSVFIILGGKKIRPLAPLIGVVGAGTAMAVNLGLITHSLLKTQTFMWTWLSTSGLKTLPLFGVEPPLLSDVSVGFLIDPLNLLMLTVVTIISFFVQVFSVFYMHDEGDRSRYFAFLSLFSFSMIGLVLSANLLQTFMFWELVGLTSYLLIGFWFEKPAAAEAARKAFVVNRLADLGFLAGIAMLFLMYGSLDIQALRTETLEAAVPRCMIEVIGVLIFLGIAGKSAQFPFHIWLPDAMEGPTPVSALIHSATMVAAGVFLFSRIFDLFAISPVVLGIILGTGAVTALLSATLATVQRDIKRILAYSTVSQLGLMIMGIAAGSPGAGMYHLVTHAFFKSLLFLTAGALIHRFGTNDIYEIGERGGKKDMVLMGALAFGLASLCGIPPFGGFFSKDAILHELSVASPYAYAAGLLVTLFTAFYSFRLFIVIFASRVSGKHHGHEASTILKLYERLPLLVLAGLSLAAGFAGMNATAMPLFHEIDPHFHGVEIRLDLVLATGAAIILGALWAVARYRNPEKTASRAKGAAVSPIQSVLEKKYFMDDLYALAVRGVGLRIAALFQWFDSTVINGIMVNGTALNTRKLGRIFSKVQSGQLHDYLFIAVLSLVAVLAYFLKAGIR